MITEQIKREYKETILTGNYAFVQCCFEIAIRQATEANERLKNARTSK